jgi:hypothetical protein
MAAGALQDIPGAVVRTLHVCTRRRSSYTTFDGIQETLGGLLLAQEVLGNGGIQHLSSRAEFLANGVHLAGQQVKEGEILILVADEVVGDHVPELAMPVHTSVPLFQLRGAPREFLVDDVAAGLLEVQALAGGVGGHHQAEVGHGVVEELLDPVAILGVAGAMQFLDPRGLEAVGVEPSPEVIQGVAVFGEEDQPLVGPISSRSQ